MPMRVAGAQWLDEARYLSLATFRRNGAQVNTAVWFARDDRVQVANVQGANAQDANVQADGANTHALYVFSAPDAGKVKRLRMHARSRIAPCDVRGALQGDWLDARTRLVSSPEEIATALRLLRRKYGWQVHLLNLGARLTGRFARRQYLRIEVPIDVPIDVPIEAPADVSIGA